MWFSRLSATFVAAVLVAAVSTVAIGPFGENVHPRSYYEERFNSWINDFDVKFDGEDYEHRLQIFANSDDLIHRHNANPSTTFTMSHNPYSHLTWHEFKSTFSIGRPLLTRPVVPFETEVDALPQASRMLSNEVELAKEIDWRVKGAVTPVKNQGSCGSCWSFSTTGAMEGAFFIKTGTLDSFSEQELVDCDKYDSGCGGGLMDFAFHWIQENGGICLEDDYAYTARNGRCQPNKCKVVPGTNVASWVDVEPNEEALMEAVMKQPVSIAIEADEAAFQFYSGGVLTSGCGTNLDHGVLLVGYGTSEDGLDYWTIKNSWGPEWGDSGYIKILRGADQEGGECGILESASYPVLFK